VSCVARVDVVSDSAKLRTTSRKLGTEPVVIAFTRGMVIVGALAWPVNGIAALDRMRLISISIIRRTLAGLQYLWVKVKFDVGPYTKSLGVVSGYNPIRRGRISCLRNASTTMNMTLSNGAEIIEPSCRSDQVARPGRKAL
jgi:hypothetical protein